MATKPVFQRIVHPEGSGVGFGAIVSNVDVENLTGKISYSPQCDDAGNYVVRVLGEYP